MLITLAVWKAERNKLLEDLANCCNLKRIRSGLHWFCYAVEMCIVFHIQSNDIIVLNFKFNKFTNLSHDQPQMCAFSYFRSCKKDGDHTIQLAVGENPMVHAHFTTLCVTPRYWWWGFTLHGSGFVLTCRHPLRMYLLWTFFGPVTSTSTRWPSYTNWTCIA